MIEEILSAVKTLAETAHPYADIAFGSLPADNGICMALGAGSGDTFLDTGLKYDLSIVLNGKHTNQKTVCSTLDTIHRTLTQRKSFPSGVGWEITTIVTTSLPSYIGREEREQYLYGSSLRVSVYIAKGA